MFILSQRDPRWSNITIGGTNIPLGKYGCTITAMSMLTDYFKNYSPPDEIAKLQKFTPDGLIVWSLLNLKAMSFEKRLYGRQGVEIEKSLTDPKKAVILQVEGYHWVVALSKIPFTSIYRIADPWDGKKKFSTAYKSITGSAHFIKKS